ncbi:hypothetical protein NPIL_437231 [Nephila pilipes]|uniref:Uncharacterized protein n=1 Tax=Nephila pilipes TaxID=299642 RepID=A0A8X6UEZ3_NEPPI|nr:hypothetical protein NPIL_437231 [Nephila pilipes]
MGCKGTDHYFCGKNLPPQMRKKAGGEVCAASIHEMAFSHGARNYPNFPESHASPETGNVSINPAWRPLQRQETLREKVVRSHSSFK